MKQKSFTNKLLRSMASIVGVLLFMMAVSVPTAAQPAGRSAAITSNPFVWLQDQGMDANPGWVDCFNLYEFEHSARNLGMGNSRFLSNPAMLGWSKHLAVGFDYQFDRNRHHDFDFVTGGGVKTEYEQDFHWFYPHVVIPTYIGALALSYQSNSQDSRNTSFRTLDVDQFQAAWGVALNEYFSLGYEFIYLGRNEGGPQHMIESDESFVQRLGMTSRCGPTYFGMSGYYMVDHSSLRLTPANLTNEQMDRNFYGFDVGAGAVSDFGMVHLNLQYDYLRDWYGWFNQQNNMLTRVKSYDRVLRLVLGGECHLSESFTTRAGVAYNGFEDDNFLSFGTGLSWSLTRSLVLDYGFEGRETNSGFNISHAVGCSYRF